MSNFQKTLLPLTRNDDGKLTRNTYKRGTLSRVGLTGVQVDAALRRGKTFSPTTPRRIVNVISFGLFT